VIALGASLILQLTISFHYGISDQLSIFLSTSALPYMIGGIIAGGLNYGMLSVFNDISLKRRSAESENDPYLFGSFLLFFIIFSALGCTLNFVLNKGVSLDIFIVWITSALIAFNGYLLVIFVSNGVYSPSSISGLVLNFTAISFLLITQNKSASGLCFSYLFGNLALAIYLFSKALKKGWINYCAIRFQFSIRAHAKPIFDATLVTMIFAIIPWFDSLFYLVVNDRALAEVSYAYKLSTSIASLLAVGPFIVFQRKLSQTFEIDRNLYYRDLFRLSQVTFIVQFAIAVLLSAIKFDVLRLVYERGAFTFNDVSKVARIFPFYLFGSCYMIGVSLIFRGFFMCRLSKLTRYILLFFVIIYLLGMLTLYFRASSLIFALSYMLSWYLTFVLSFIFFFNNKLKNSKIFILTLMFHLLILILSLYVLLG